MVSRKHAAHYFFIMANPYDILNQAVETAGNYSNDPLAGTILERWFTPGEVQQREFGQQVALQQYQNEWQAKENEKWNDERQKYARLKELGINDYVIGQALAGSSSSANSPTSVGGVPSTPNGLSLGEIAEGANAVTGGSASLAEAAFKNSTLKPTLENLAADVETKLAGLGLTNEQIYAWKVDNKYRDQNAQADLRIKSLNEKNLAKEWEVMHSQYELNTTRLDTEVANQKLAYETAKLRASEAEAKEAEAAYLAALKSKTDFEAQFAQIRVDFWKSRGFDILASSTDMVLVQKLENGESISSIVREMSDYYGNRVDAEQQAMSKYVFTNSFNAAAGANNANFDYEWQIPPKTLAEFAAKGASNFKEKLKSKFNTPVPIDKIDKTTNDDLKQSYVDFQTQLQRQIVLLNLQKADCIDEKSGKIVDFDKYTEIQKSLAEIEKLPKSYKQFVKYVQSQ